MKKFCRVLQRSIACSEVTARSIVSQMKPHVARIHSVNMYVAYPFVPVLGHGSETKSLLSTLLVKYLLPQYTCMLSYSICLCHNSQIFSPTGLSRALQPADFLNRDNWPLAGGSRVSYWIVMKSSQSVPCSTERQPNVTAVSSGLHSLLRHIPLCTWVKFNVVTGRLYQPLTKATCTSSNSCFMKGRGFFSASNINFLWNWHHYGYRVTRKLYYEQPQTKESSQIYSEARIFWGSQESMTCSKTW